jgi:hypothetical protein
VDCTRQSSGSNVGPRSLEFSPGGDVFSPDADPPTRHAAARFPGAILGTGSCSHSKLERVPQDVQWVAPFDSNHRAVGPRDLEGNDREGPSPRVPPPRQGGRGPT